jgi:hypothetical protein
MFLFEIFVPTKDLVKPTSIKYREFRPWKCYTWVNVTSVGIFSEPWRSERFSGSFYLRTMKFWWGIYNTGCSFWRIFRRPEHLIGRHWYLQANWRSFIRWSLDSQCYAFECDRNFYCAMFYVFMTREIQCPVSLRSENPLWFTHEIRTILAIKWRHDILVK